MAMDRSSTLISEFGKESLLSVIPGLDKLTLERGQVRFFKAGETVVQRGEEIQYLIIPITSGLQLVTQNDQAEEKAVHFLRKQQSLALKDLLLGKAYPYSVISEVDNRLLFLAKADFLAHLEKHPELKHYLSLITQSSAFRNFRNFLKERGIKVQDIYRIFSQLEANFHKLEPDSNLDMPEASLVFVHSGRLEIRNKDPQVNSFSSELTEGAWFGGEALVAPFQVSYAAKSIEETIIIQTPLEPLRAVLKNYSLIEPIFDEPWLTKRNKLEKRRPSVATAIPGRALTENEARERGLALDFSRICFAQADSESYYASVVNVCGILGIKVSATSVETELNLESKVSPLKIAEVLESLGLHTRATRTKLPDVFGLELPLLTFIGNRLVVLLEVNAKPKELTLLDPARGPLVVKFSEMEPIWSGSTLWVKRQISAELPTGKKIDSEKEAGFGLPFLSNLSKSRFLIDGLFRNRAILINLMALTLIGILLQLATPVLSGVILDQVLSLKDTKTLWTCVIGLTLAGAFSVGISILREIAQNEFAICYDQEISSLVYRQALSSPAGAFSKHKTGDVLARIRAISSIRQFLSGSSFEAVIGIFSIFIYSIVLLFYSVKVAFIAVVILAATITLQALFRKKLVDNYEQSYEAGAAANSLLAEQIGAITTIKSSNAEDEMRRRTESTLIKVIKVYRENTRSGAILRGLIGLITVSGRIAALWIAASLALKNQLSPGAILAVSLYVGQMIEPINSLSGILGEMANFEVSVKRLQELMHPKPGLDRSIKTLATHNFPLRGKIRLDNLNFRYDAASPWVLKNINLTIYPKQTVAIVGRSGCGKSTLANLIAGNMEATSGKIFFDDFDSVFLSRSSLKKQIGFIMQGNELFAGSIGENIRFAYDWYDFEKTVEYAKKASAEFILNLPSGFGYYLGEAGIGLSGGEKQRISVARTLRRNPKVIILDEATSALDAISEKSLTDNLNELFKEKTAIVIAHRLSTIRGADRILVMDKGEIIEDGTHNELLDRQGHYFRLFQNQMNLTDL